MNVEPVAIKLLLQETDQDKALEYYAELDPRYFSSTFQNVIKHISDFYKKNDHIPNTRELEVFRARDRRTLSALASIELTNVEGLDLSQVISELENNFVQDTTLTLMEGILENIAVMDKDEIQDQVARMSVVLEDQISSTEKVFTARDYKPFVPKDISDISRISSGISDEWDNEAGGYFIEDFVLFGGKRGSGKSIVCANLIRAQHEQGNVSVYATIEMSYTEVMDRILSALSGVPHNKIKLRETNEDEDRLVALAHAKLFVGGEELFKEYFDSGSRVDKFKFQDELIKLPEKDEGRIIIIDDRNLSVSTLDAKLSSYKARYGDLLKLVVVDYVNQLELYPGADMYSWTNQIELSKALKNQARKQKVVLVSPYQMDDNGQARFAKGLLDSADVAHLIYVDDKESNTIVFETTKARSAADDGVHRVSIDWDILKIDPAKAYLPEVDQSGNEDDTPQARELDY